MIKKILPSFGFCLVFLFFNVKNSRFSFLEIQCKINLFYHYFWWWNWTLEYILQYYSEQIRLFWKSVLRFRLHFLMTWGCIGIQISLSKGNANLIITSLTTQILRRLLTREVQFRWRQEWLLSEHHFLFVNEWTRSRWIYHTVPLSYSWKCCRTSINIMKIQQFTHIYNGEN